MRTDEETFLTRMDDRGRIQVPLDIRRYLGVDGESVFVRVTIKVEKKDEMNQSQT
jgi:bifunctional DNA-binding transcriptional regulator/antitoxin component of YhaV-PrlF toxin-antitoxin module